MRSGGSPGMPGEARPLAAETTSRVKPFWFRIIAIRKLKCQWTENSKIYLELNQNVENLHTINMRGEVGYKLCENLHSPLRVYVLQDLPHNYGRI